MPPVIEARMREAKLRLRAPLARALCALALVAATGCVDAPTSPALVEWLAADGELAAVLPPRSLPDPAEWLAADARGSARVAALADASDQALRHGRMSTAARLRAEAGSLAAASLSGAPDPGLLRRSGEAVDLWLLAVRGSAGTPSAGGLALLDSVAGGRESASASLAAGDTLAAARTLIRTAEQIRGGAPRLALLRVIDRTDARVATLGPASRESERARHLVRTARLALEGDDALRALRRVVYAAQLAGGQELEEIAPEE